MVTLDIYRKIIFAREQKCIINHSGLAFCAGMVVTNTSSVLEKFLINVFPPKDFLIFLLNFPGTDRPDREGNPGLPENISTFKRINSI